MIENSMSYINHLTQILQLGDSVLPIGTFAFSNGLETAVQEKRMTNSSELQEYLSTVVKQVAHTDGIGLLEAFRARINGDTDKIVAVDHAVYRRKGNEETRLMTTRMGKKLLDVAKEVQEDAILASWREKIDEKASPGCYPVSLGVCTASLGLDEQEAFAIQHYGTAMMILSAALRLMKIGHLEVQKVLHEINKMAPGLYVEVVGKTMKDMHAFSPMMDIMAAIHLKAHVRLFMN